MSLAGHRRTGSLFGEKNSKEKEGKGGESPFRFSLSLVPRSTKGLFTGYLAARNLACENIRFSSLFPGGEEPGEMDVFTGYSVISLLKHPFLHALRRWGRFVRAKHPKRRRARRNGCFRRLARNGCCCHSFFWSRSRSGVV